MNASLYLHSQRPEYHRVGIDLAYRLVENYIEKVGIVCPRVFSKERIYIVSSEFVGKLPLKGGLYLTNNDSIYINLSLLLSISPIVHELFHAFSSSHRGAKPDKTYSTGFSRDIIYSENVQRCIATNNGFNEGVTTSMQKSLWIQKNADEVIEYQKRFAEIQRRINALLKFKGKETYENYYYFGYTKERAFVEAFIDTLCYIRIKGKERDFEEEKRKLWREMEQAYFLGDIKWLESACNEIDATGKLQKEVEISQPHNEVFGALTQKLIAHTRESFNGLYIPTKL